MRTMEEKKAEVMRYLRSRGDWCSPTEIGMAALGFGYYRASSDACKVLFVLLKEKLVERSSGVGKYRSIDWNRKNE